MEIYSQKSEYTLLQGNMLDMWDFVGGGTIDSIVTDPPYELNFMWKGWDNSWIAFQPDTWKRCLEALKPWWYLLAFGGSRTYHRIACAIEDAGFEIRDCIMWLYGSWFPKSMALDKSIEWKLTTWSANKTEFKKLNWEKVERGNYWYAKMQNEQWNRPADYNKIDENRLWTLEATTELAKQYKGWWTALKPSYEPIIVARKPLEWSCTDNVIKYWVGGINIDECRVESNGEKIAVAKDFQDTNYSSQFGNENFRFKQVNTELKEQGRFPANTILTYDESDFEEVCGGFPYTKSWSKMSFGSVRKAQPDNTYQLWFTKHENSWQTAPDNYWDSGNASRYFYCAKASKRDRDEWLQEFETKSHAEINNRKEWSAWAERAYWWGTNPYLSVSSPRKNTHPTVKPCDLMQYLVRLVTPNWWTVLDPFNWSGSTWKAVMYENKDRNKNYKYIWIELTEEYLPIAKARIEYVINKGIEKEKSDPKQEEQTKQRKESALF